MKRNTPIRAVSWALGLALVAAPGSWAETNTPAASGRAPVTAEKDAGNPQAAESGPVLPGPANPKQATDREGLAGGASGKIGGNADCKVRPTNEDARKKCEQLEAAERRRGLDEPVSE